MRGGFFPSSKLLASKAPMPTVAQCGQCGLYKGCDSPKMRIDGDGERCILIVGEAPGKDEDNEGRPFVGKSGKHLDSVLRNNGINMRRDCWITNSLICRPAGNATPDDKEIGYCRPNVYAAIRELAPRVILLVGGIAVKSVIGPLWREKPGSMEKWAGWQIPSQKLNAWICPTYHPAYLGYQNSPVLNLLFERHIAQAATITEQPWIKVPDYESRVERILDPDKACDAIEWFIENSKILAFDYETNMLKPDSKQARIVCCSISSGKRTIAFPWQGPVKTIMISLLRDKSIGKIASNMKFEERWTRAEFGHGVENWHWDTMLAAHVDDNRRDITSIKFQSFIHLGFPAYDDHIRPLLEAEGGNIENEVIKEIDLMDLLLYNGLDSLVEYKVAAIQMERLNARTNHS